MKKKLSNKHDHKLTHFLKVFIYMLVMLAPFLAIASKVWYVASNKNAYNSYRGTYQYVANTKLTEILNNGTTFTTITSNNNNYYRLDNSNIEHHYEGKIVINGISNNTSACYLATCDNLTFNNNTFNDAQFYVIWVGNGNSMSIAMWNTPFDESYYFTWNGSTPNLDAFKVFDSLGNNIPYSNGYRNAQNNTLSVDIYKIYKLSTQVNFNIMNDISTDLFVYDTTLSSVFYSAIDELDKASIFSWTTNTELYPAINNMCMMLGISSPPLAVLLTYWMLITIIYVIIDIVIEMIIWLTHLANDQLL